MTCVPEISIRRKYKFYVFLITILFAAARGSFAGFVWTYATGNCLSKTYVENEKMRVESSCGATPKIDTFSTVVIFRNDKNLMWTINGKTNQYVEKTKAEMQTKNAELMEFDKKATAISKNAYARMTLEEKKDLEKAGRDSGDSSFTEMMDAIHGRSKRNDTFIYKPTREMWTVKNWNCQVYEFLKNQKKVSEVCVADGNQILAGLGDVAHSSLNLQKEVFTVYAADIKAMEKAQQEAMGPTWFILKEVFQVPGKPASVRELVEARKEAVPPSQFELPHGAKQTAGF